MKFVCDFLKRKTEHSENRWESEMNVCSLVDMHVEMHREHCSMSARGVVLLETSTMEAF
jgi:hypothetical protein